MSARWSALTVRINAIGAESRFKGGEFECSVLRVNARCAAARMVTIPLGAGIIRVRELGDEPPLHSQRMGRGFFYAGMGMGNGEWGMEWAECLEMNGEWGMGNGE